MKLSASYNQFGVLYVAAGTFNVKICCDGENEDHKISGAFLSWRGQAGRKTPGPEVAQYPSGFKMCH
jgi:hypothetical protein